MCCGGQYNRTAFLFNTAARKKIKPLQRVLLNYTGVCLGEKMKNKLLLSLAFSASITLNNNITFAADDNSIIVTATRTAQSVDESLASVTVITKEQIEQQQANDIPELLNGIQGIDISNSGGLGKSTSIYMRGTNSNHVLILVDGIRINSATSGTTAIEHIPVAQIERIEVVRGPRASLYGADAISGVIQIFTKKSTSNNVNASIGYGSQNTTKATIGFDTVSEKNNFSLNIGYIDTKGIDALKAKNPDEDSFNNKSINANFKHQFSKVSSLSATLMIAQGNNEYDNSFAPNLTSTYDADFTQQIIGVNYTTKPISNWQVGLKASQSQDKTENFTNAQTSGTFNTERDMLTWKNDITLSDSLLLTAGIDYSNDKVSSTTQYDETTRDNTAYFIQQQWFGDTSDLAIALRTDDNEAFGSHTTGNVSWGIDLGNNYRVISSYGTGFHTPSFNFLYFPGFSNPSLKPEESESYEIELRGKTNNSHWNVNVYHTEISNLIVSPAPSYLPVNLDKATIDGLEIATKLKQKDFDTSVQLSFIDPTNDSTKKVLPRRAKRTLKFNIDQNTGNWRSGIEVLIQSSRFNDTANTTKLAGYSVINLNTRYSLSKQWTLRANINNLLAKEYQTASNYNNEGLGVFASIHYSGD